MSLPWANTVAGDGAVAPPQGVTVPDDSDAAADAVVAVAPDAFRDEGADAVAAEAAVASLAGGTSPSVADITPHRSSKHLVLNSVNKCSSSVNNETTDVMLRQPQRMMPQQLNECPKFLSLDPSDETHSINLTRENFRISLSLHGTIQYFPTRKPTPKEYHDCPDTHLHELTYEQPDWNPDSLSFNRQEENMTDTFGQLNEPHTRSYNRNIAAISAPLRTLETVNNENSYTRARQHSEYHSQCSAVLSNVTNTLNDDQFATALTKEDVKVRYSSIHSTTTGSKQSKLTAPEFARKWNIGLEAAEQTLKVTTQRGVRNVTRQNLTKRYPTNDHHFRYRHLNTTLFTDTLVANSPSTRGNKYARVYCNDLEWSRLYLMKKKS
jgi:hypothetical protein